MTGKISYNGKLKNYVNIMDESTYFNIEQPCAKVSAWPFIS